MKTRIDAMLTGHDVVAWTFLAKDWADQKSEQLVQRVAERIRPGVIILMHDGLYAQLDKAYADRTHTLQAVEIILEHFSSTYQFVTVPQLLDSGKPIRTLWKRKPDMSWMAQLKTADGKSRWIDKAN
jgi:peptidoglycan/xylan/chitin deacetylase (PgdA/CDA1 family)